MGVATVPDNPHDDAHDGHTERSSVGRQMSPIQPVILPAFADDPVDPMVDQPIDGVLDAGSLDGGLPYLSPDAPDPGPTIARSDQAFVRAYAILDGLDRPGGLIPPDVRCADLSFAVLELTEDGQNYPDPFLELADATDATTVDDALDDAVSALNELITSSTDLTRTVRLTRARSMVRHVAEDLRTTEPGGAS